MNAKKGKLEAEIKMYEAQESELEINEEDMERVEQPSDSNANKMEHPKASEDTVPEVQTWSVEVDTEAEGYVPEEDNKVLDDNEELENSENLTREMMELRNEEMKLLELIALKEAEQKKME